MHQTYDPSGQGRALTSKKFASFVEHCKIGARSVVAQVQPQPQPQPQPRSHVHLVDVT